MQQKFKLCGAGEGLWPHLPPEHLPASLDLGGHLDLDWEVRVRVRARARVRVRVSRPHPNPTLTLTLTPPR